MAATRLEIWKDARDEFRWTLWFGGLKAGGEAKVAVSPSSYASAGEAHGAFMLVVDALRFDTPTTTGLVDRNDPAAADGVDDDPRR